MQRDYTSISHQDTYGLADVLEIAPRQIVAAHIVGYINKRNLVNQEEKDRQTRIKLTEIALSLLEVERKIKELIKHIKVN